MQLNLFSTGITCSHCNKDPGINQNPNLWNGFFDMDTKQYVCITCKTKHYQQKNNSPHAHHYSEFPVMNPIILKTIK